MILDNKFYVPTLAIRASEMNGLEYLPGASKDRMSPCILLAPWANASSLSKAIDRVERAFRNRYYFLDVDRDYQVTNTDNITQQELISLLDPSNSYEKWCDFTNSRKWILPCIQTRGQNEQNILEQIKRYQVNLKPYCLRLFMDRLPPNIDEILNALSKAGTADYVVILEGGWNVDSLLLESKFSGLIASLSSEIDANIPIVTSCTSMPKEFTVFDNGTNIVDFNNRQLVTNLQNKTNRKNITYGDWGSTRPREPSGYGGRPLDRIDYPIKDKWIITRNKKKSWTFKEAASDLINNSGYWDGNLGIWGEEMIKNTTVNSTLGIDTPQKNVAARVNIHLHRQAMYDTDNLSSINLDEDWED